MRHNATIWVGIFLYIVYHFLSLSYSPLPWFDEVSFASMTQSYSVDGTFMETVRRYSVPHPRLEYGPIYFVLQSYIIKLFGLSLYVFRMNSLLFGFLNVFLVYKICQKFEFGRSATLMTIVLLLLNPALNQSMHSGRMDMLAIFFLLSSFMSLMKIKDGSLKSYLFAALAGLLLGGAMLTTPRIVFALAMFVVWCAYVLFYLRARPVVLLPYLLVPVIFVVMYFCWMQIAFGGLEGYISYFKNSHELNRHIGATSQPLNYQIGISIFALIVGSFAYFGKADARRSAIFPLTATGLIFFHIIVAGSYIYYAFAIPLAALAIGWSFGQLKDKVYFRTAIYVVLILSAATFVLKSAVVVATVPQRSEDYYYEAYAKNIPRDASVAGDFTYYYMAVKNNNPFEIIIENGPYKGITQYFLAKKVKYIVLSKRNPDIAKFEKLLLNEHYRLVSTVENKKRIPVLSNLIDHLPWFITTDYAYTVYQLVE